MNTSALSAARHTADTVPTGAGLLALVLQPLPAGCSTPDVTAPRWYQPALTAGCLARQLLPGSTWLKQVAPPLMARAYALPRVQHTAATVAAAAEVVLQPTALAAARRAVTTRGASCGFLAPAHVTTSLPPTLVPAVAAAAKKSNTGQDVARSICARGTLCCTRTLPCHAAAGSWR